jgi:RNA polymerase sigma factor (sigma-70 family)
LPGNGLRTATTTALLDGLSDPGNQEVWLEFDARYRPMIHSFATRLGLSDADASDVAQETLVRFIREYRAGRYDRTRGRLRSWIIAIVRYRIADLRREQAARREHRGESALIDLPADNHLEELWSAERSRVLMSQALSELRSQTRLSEKTMLAFEQYVLRNRPVREVADELGLSRQDIYMAKNRVAEKLRETMQRLRDVFDDE